MPETGRLEMRLDATTRHDLEQLAKRLNVNRAAAIRFALREAASGGDRALDVDPPAA